MIGCSTNDRGFVGSPQGDGCLFSPVVHSRVAHPVDDVDKTGRYGRDSHSSSILADRMAEEDNKAVRVSVVTKNSQVRSVLLVRGQEE